MIIHGKLDRAAETEPHPPVIQTGRNLTSRAACCGLAGCCVLLAMPVVQADMIREIIVTAQKREELIQDVPMSISAYSGDNLEELGVRNLTDLGSHTSGVEMLNADCSQPTYSIRGIQTFDFTAGSDPTVAVYVDGIYASRDAGAEIPLSDIDRVEILKGPQGTLLGRNAIGGAIHIVTREPGPIQAAGMHTSVSNLGGRDAEVVWNQPLNESLALRLSAASHRHDGWMENIAGSDQNQEDNQAFRLALGWTPDDDLHLIWRASYDVRDQYSGTIPTITDAVSVFGNPSQDRADPFGPVAIDGRNLEQRDLFTTSLHITRDYEAFTFTSITGWRNFNTDFWQDEDGSANVDYTFNSLLQTDDDQFSQELRWNGDTETLKWTLGAVFAREHIDRLSLGELRRTTLETFALWEAAKAQLLPAGLTESQIAEQLPYLRAQNRVEGLDGIAVASFVSQLVQPCGVGVPVDTCAQLILPAVQQELLNMDPWTETVRNTGTFESRALYGDVTWSLNDRVDLTAGLRYTEDRKTFTIFSAYQNSLLGMPIGIVFHNKGLPLLDSRESDDWDALSGRLVLGYKLDTDRLAYASIATGFKSGGFNSLNYGPGVQTAYDSEELVNYEIGMKGDFLDHSLRLNGAAFFYQYQDLQELDLVGVPIPHYNIRNADAEGSGLELDFIWAPGERLTLMGNYSYLETRYTDYQIIEAIGETAADDKTGKPRSGTPRNKVNLSMIFNQALTNLGTIAYRLDYTYIGHRLSARVNSDEQDPFRKVKGYGLWSGRISLISPARHWELAVWARNLLDDNIIGDFADMGQTIGSLTAWPLEPRRFGLDLNYSF